MRAWRWGIGWGLGGALVLACAPPPAQRPTPPSLVGEDPAVGRRFVLDLDEEGRAVRLEGVPGRALLLCVLGEGVDEAIVAACEAESARWRDHLVVLGLATSQREDLGRIPFRTYRDPGGAALRENLALGAGPQVVLVDGRGRVARSIPPDGLDALPAVVAAAIPGVAKAPPASEERAPTPPEEGLPVELGEPPLPIEP